MVLEYSYKHRLRRKEILKLAESLNSHLGTATFSENDDVETATLKGLSQRAEFDLIFLGTDVVGIIIGGRPMLTVLGLLKYGASRKYVTVDMGAVPYIYNGADVMTPGITDADEGIVRGDFVWVRDEKNFKPLSVGEALMSGAELKAQKKGKGVRTIHRVGDEIWLLSDEKR